MKQKTSMIHPNFIIGLISYFGLLAGVVMYSNDLEIAKTVIAGSLILGVVHWLISVVSVIRDQLRKQYEGLWFFWFTAVFLVPPIGGMMYYMVNNKRVLV